MSDEEIQKKFEADMFTSVRDSEHRAYGIVFRALSQSPTVKISDTFAERVVKKIVAQRKREARRDFIWLMLGVVFLMVGLIVTASIAGLQFELGFLKEMSHYGGIFIFGIIVILAFSWIEKKALPKTSQ
ncbi:MAG TPA: hypothetical protein VGD65_00810 [Chryseosolibacter sp.]